MLIYAAGLIVGLMVLVFSADRFVDGTAAIARNFGISPLIIGLTIVGFGTSAPEIIVSTIASWQGKTGLAIGNAIGSNIANIGLICGCTALITPIAVKSEILRRELPILLLTTLFCYLLIIDGELNRTDGIIMLSTLFVFMIWLVRTAIKHRNIDTLNSEFDQEIPQHIPTSKAIIWFILGLFGLLLSSRLLVWSAVQIAIFFEVSELVIGLTIVAIGTSLPELAASISSILKKEYDLAIGNVIGSNMYNLLAVLSLPGIIAPGPMDVHVLTRDYPFMVGFTIALFAMGFSIKKQGSINRLEGGLILGAFCIYQFIIYQSSF